MSKFCKVIQKNLSRSNRLFLDLIEGIPEKALQEKLPGLRSNTIGSQLWCVIGARESYGAAIKAGKWTGFSCSLTGAQSVSQADLISVFNSSALFLEEITSDTSQYSEAQIQFIVDLLEHELAHQGQLIRYLYGLNLSIPESWKHRFALSD